MKTLIIDNYDSFTFNLYQYVTELGGQPEVITNDSVTLQEIINRKYTNIIISPGPGSVENPKDFGICLKIIQEIGKTTPILGVCLGHQGIAYAFGAKIAPSPQIMHGKTSLISHDKSLIYQGIPTNFKAMRYHSLCVSKENFPPSLKITAICPADETIMSLEHGKFPIYGIQFHPESFQTPHGKQIIKNFLNITP